MAIIKGKEIFFSAKVSFDRYEEGKEEGKQAQYDEFWDSYQDKGNRRLYLNAFSRDGWNPTTYNPKYPIIGGSYGLRQVFEQAQWLTDTKVTLIDTVGNLTTCFHYCTRLKKIPLLKFEVPITGNISNAFTNCASLEDVTIEGEIAVSGLNLQWSSRLTHDSLMSFINALADKSEDTSGTDWKLLIGATNIAKLSEDDVKIATLKGWRLE